MRRSMASAPLRAGARRRGGLPRWANVHTGHIAHAAHDGAQVRFGVHEEGARRDDRVSGLEPAQDLEPVLVRSADHHRAGLVGTVRPLEEGECALASHQHGRAGHGERCVGRGREAKRRVHARLQCQARVRELDSHARGAGGWVERGVDVGDRALPRLAGERLEIHSRGLADPHVGQVALEHLALDPDGREVGDAEERVARHDPLPLLHQLLQHDAGDRRAERHRAARLAGPLYLLDRLRRHVPVPQAASRRFGEARGATLRIHGPCRHLPAEPPGQQQLLLGGDEHGRVEIHQRLAPTHRLPGEVDMQSLDPPVHLESHRGQPGLVAGHLCHGPYRAAEGRAGDFREGDADAPGVGWGEVYFPQAVTGGSSLGGVVVTAGRRAVLRPRLRNTTRAPAPASTRRNSTTPPRLGASAGAGTAEESRSSGTSRHGTRGVALGKQWCGGHHLELGNGLPELGRRRYVGLRDSGSRSSGRRAAS